MKNIHHLNTTAALLLAASTLIGPSSVRGATLTVTNTADSGSGTLRQAIADVAPNDTIDFAVFGVITLTSGQLTIDKDLNIAGPGATNLTVSGNLSNRVFSVTSGTVSISGLTIADGGVTSDPFGPGGVGRGAGIFNNATLTLNQCVLSNNIVAGISGEGGAIYNGGTLQINQCTLHGNQANQGGGINNAGLLVLTNSTLSANVAFSRFYAGQGGGINNSGTLTINFSTFSGNTAEYQGGGIYQVGGSLNVSHSTFADASGGGGGGDIHKSSGTATFGNCLVVNRLSGAFTSAGYNLISQTDGATGFTNGINHDLAGTSAAPLNSQLLPLADNGGFTKTHALRLGSPAIDAGTSGGATSDQRGRPRVFDWAGGPNVGDGCDIGAYENHPFSFAEALDNGNLAWATSGDAAWFGQNGEIRDDFDSAQSGAIADNQQSVLSTIVNGPGKLSFWWKVSSKDNGDYLRLLVSGAEEAAISGESDWERKVLYLGAGAHTVQWVYAKNGSASAGQDSGWVDEVRFVPGDTGPSTLTVTNLADSGSGTLRDLLGMANDDDTIDFGVAGTITLTNGHLVISKHLRIAGPGAANVTINGNLNQRIFQVAARTSVKISGLKLMNGRPVDFQDGGAVLNAGTLALADCIISGSRAYDGGGIYNTGSLTVSNSTISGNAITYDGYGGGINNAGGTVTVTGCAIIGNSSGNDISDGGGIYNPQGTLIVNNSLISGNTAYAGVGGGIYNHGICNITNSTISGNTSIAGGGFLNEAGTSTIFACTISGNNAYDDDGGGLWNNGTMNVLNSTVFGNSCDFGGGGIYAAGTVTLISTTITGNLGYDGGGIDGTATIRNSIIAGNGTHTVTGHGADCRGTLVSADYNLIQNTTDCTITGTTAHNVIGLDAKLGLLANNGGATFTCALLTGSPAIDRGDSSGLATDQRGQSRGIDNPDFPNTSGGDTSDIGAFEAATSVGDGLPDSWELQYFGNIGFGPYDDVDADGALKLGRVPGRLQNPAGTTGAPQLVSPLLTVSGQFQFQLSGPVGSNYVIQASADLTTWIPIATNVIPAGGSLSITDPQAANHPQRFYRAVSK